MCEDFKLSDEALYFGSETACSFDDTKMLESFRGRSLEKSNYAHSTLWDFNENIYLRKMGPWTSEESRKLHFEELKKKLEPGEFYLLENENENKEEGEVDYFSD